MSILAASMPKDPNKKRVEVHLLPDDFKKFEALAKANHWSNKKFAEIIVMKYLQKQKKKNANR